MGKIRKNYSASFKAKVALEAVKKEKTISQLSSEYGVHSNQINQWRKRLLEELPDIVSKKRQKKEKDTEELQAELYQQIGQLKVELDWLKKKSKLLNCYKASMQRSESLSGTHSAPVRSFRDKQIDLLLSILQRREL